METPKKFELGVTRGKLALVFALAVAFVTALAYSWPETEQQSTVSLARPVRTASPSATSGNATRANLPAMTLDEILAHDPFAVGSTEAHAQIQAEAPSVAKRAEQSPAAANEKMLAAIFGQSAVAVVGAEQSVMRLGTRTLGVGDRINGFLIVEIGLQGVVLEKMHDDDLKESPRE